MQASREDERGGMQSKSSVLLVLLHLFKWWSVWALLPLLKRKARAALPSCSPELYRCNEKALKLSVLLLVLPLLPLLMQLAPTAGSRELSALSQIALFSKPGSPLLRYQAEAGPAAAAAAAAVCTERGTVEGTGPAAAAATAPAAAAAAGE